MEVLQVCLLGLSSKADFETEILQDLLSTTVTPLVFVRLLLLFVLYSYISIYVNSKVS